VAVNVHIFFLYFLKIFFFLFTEKKEKIDCVKLLIDFGAQLNEKNMTGGTPLHDAAEHGHIECLSKLIECGAEVNEKDNDGETPLHAATHAESLDVIKELLKHGADKNIRNNVGLLPVDIANQKGHKNCAELLKND